MSAVEVIGEDEPNILLEEVKEAMNAMKKRKVPDCDGNETELWPALKENGLKTVWSLYSVI